MSAATGIMTETGKSPAAAEPPLNNTASDPPPDYWGPMIRHDKTPTDQFDRLLRGIAFCISTSIIGTDNYDLTPAQMGAFYRSVGGNYDDLFITVPPQSISLIYRSLGCLHSLQPMSGDDKYAYPSVPALKPSGFVTWQTIQLLLGPSEHVPIIQGALQRFDVIDPVTNKPFPKTIPAEVFPLQPDEAMLRWHDGVSEKLRKEAVEAAVRARAAEPGRRRRPMSPDEDDYSADDEGRTHAARHFANPLYKNKEGKPGVLKTVTKHAPPVVRQGGALVANTVQNIINPFLWSGNNSKRSVSDRGPYDDDLYARPGSGSRPYTAGGNGSGYGSHGRGTPRRNSPRRQPPGPRSPSSESDPERAAEYRKYGRRHRSQEPPASRLSPDSIAEQNGKRSRSSSYNNIRTRDGYDPRVPPEINISPTSPYARSQHSDYFYPSGPSPGAPQYMPRGQQQRPDMHGRKQSYPNIDASLPRQPRHQPSFPSGDEGRRNSAFASLPSDPRGSAQPSRHPSTRQPHGPDRVSPLGEVDGVTGRRYANEVPWR